MAGKHYRWQVRWTVSLADQSATHESGLTYDWTLGHDAGMPPLGTVACCDKHGASWVGRLRGDEAGMRAWLDTQPALRDPTSQRNRLLRLAREAGEVYAAALRNATWVRVSA